MTEQEVEALAARLTRIWSRDVPAQGELILHSECRGTYEWDWLAELGRGVEIYVGNPRQGSLEIQLTCLPKDEFRQYGHLQYEHNAIQPWRKYIVSKRNEADYDQFDAQWMDFFRRGCWLSGCNIEASAHEKAEWMQGFSQEELQAWNLKF